MDREAIERAKSLFAQRRALRKETDGLVPRLYLVEVTCEEPVVAMSRDEAEQIARDNVRNFDLSQWNTGAEARRVREIGGDDDLYGCLPWVARGMPERECQEWVLAGALVDFFAGLARPIECGGTPDTTKETRQ